MRFSSYFPILVKYAAYHIVVDVNRRAHSTNRVATRMNQASGGQNEPGKWRPE